MKTFVSVVALFGALAASMPQGPLSASPANGRLECKTYELVDQYCGTCEYGPGPKREDWFLEQFYCELKH
ncbi:hypothetical protein E5D57_003345 [Metarhizium anisopliae]|nr:hypothetical protein E5D57_003345 [Metarhizium anisopliae]